MVHQTIFKVALAVIATLMCVSPALAGGWAVVTLDQLPAQIVAGQPIDIGFTVRQHGVTLRSDIKPIIRLDRANAEDSFTVSAVREGAAGHYTARLTFPSAGTWKWYVDVEEFGMITQPMPDLMVLATATSSKPVAPAGLSSAPARSAALPAFFTNLFRLLERVAAARAQMPAALVGQTQAQLGQKLFLAKGCAMCHRHDAVKDALNNGIGSLEIGPDLTQTKLDAGFLRGWLKDPSAIKKDTEMPALGLSDSEIEALVAFLTTKAER
jgi:cytochrome c2